MIERPTDCKTLAKYQRQAKQGILVAAIILPVAFIGFWLIEHWWRVPLVFKLIVFGITAFSLIGDTITYISTSSKIRKAREGTSTTPLRG